MTEIEFLQSKTPLKIRTPWNSIPSNISPAYFHVNTVIQNHLLCNFSDFQNPLKFRLKFYFLKNKPGLFSTYFFQIWLPDVEVLNLKMFRSLDVLDKLQGLWVSQNSEVLYVLAARITFICAMSFEAFPLDIQTCLFQVSTKTFLWWIKMKRKLLRGSENKLN